MTPLPIFFALELGWDLFDLSIKQPHEFFQAWHWHKVIEMASESVHSDVEKASAGNVRALQDLK